MLKKKLIYLQTILIINCIKVTNAVNVVLPKGAVSNEDVPNEQIKWNYSIFKLISIVNDYLRFAVWFVCFLFMIWNWYQLIMARWDSKQMKSATNALIWCAIWLVACLLAYIIVNIAIKLFN